MSNTKKLGPNYPSRKDMVRAAIYMERRGFDWEEWRIVARLCDSGKGIRHYILDYVRDMLDMWDGLKPSKGMFSSEFAYIAAFHALQAVGKEMRHYPKERIQALLETPAPWTDNEKEQAKKAFYKEHPENCRVTAKMKAVLERETAAVYHEPYITESGCTIIPFDIRQCGSTEKEETRHG